MKERKAQKVLSATFPNWSSMTNYENNRLGRIWVVWSPQLRVTPCFKSDQMITCSILMDGADDDFFCTFVYVANGVT